MSTLIGVNPAYTDSTAMHAVGARHFDHRTGIEYMYVLTTESVPQYETVWINSAFSAAKITAALAITPGSIGFSSDASIASAYYGWVRIKGPITIKVLGSCAKDVPLYTTDTAGSLDDATASASHYQVMGVIVLTTQSGATASTVAGVAPSYATIRRPAA